MSGRRLRRSNMRALRLPKLHGAADAEWLDLLRGQKSTKTSPFFV
jgi:hypothetical protein